MRGRKSQLNTILKKAKDYINGGYKDNGEVIPSISGLSFFAGCPRSSLYNYRKESEEFSNVLEMIKMRQEIELINKGLTGEFNSNIAKLMLANHGYSDKQQIDHKAEVNNKPTKIELVPAKMTNEEIIKELKSYGYSEHEIKRVVNGLTN